MKGIFDEELSLAKLIKERAPLVSDTLSKFNGDNVSMEIIAAATCSYFVVKSEKTLEHVTRELRHLDSYWLLHFGGQNKAE